VNAGNVVAYSVMTGKLEVGTVARQLHAGAVAGQVEMTVGGGWYTGQVVGG